MKILSFSYCYPNQSNPTWGVFVQHRVAAIGKRAEVRVVSPIPWFPLIARSQKDPGPAEDHWCGLTVYRPKFLCTPKVFKSLDGKLYRRWIQPWFDQFVDRFKPDVLDAHFVWPDGVGVAGLARRAKLPYSITLRGKLYPCLEEASQRRQCVDALVHADLVISVDPRMAQVAEDLGVGAERIKVIPNGVEIDRFRIGDRMEARRELGLPLDGRLIVTVAHLGQRKGHHETIAALEKLARDVNLVLVGGPGPLGGDGNNLRQLAASHGVTDRLIIAGKQSHELIPKYYQAADISVLASWREGCPNAVLESLACGTPVVATDVGSVRWMIDDGINGRVVPVRDAEQLRDGIQRVLDDPPPSDRVRSSPVVRSWDAVAEDVLNAWTGVLHRAPMAAVVNPLSNSSRSRLECN
ncbi:glycosyltransferase [Rhodopirellula sp. JC639]|uniref:glycosyltransferase n=1 Tax=Stieleria mannarensis TaxID=2755585 RepID=UPI0015FFEC50|nr:glycosyltransferase [Rhodopirellula sp. JC639]